jgi:hypothetical protein
VRAKNPGRVFSGSLCMLLALFAYDFVTGVAP